MGEEWVHEIAVINERLGTCMWAATKIAKTTDERHRNNRELERVTRSQIVSSAQRKKPYLLPLSPSPNDRDLIVTGSFE